MTEAQIIERVRERLDEDLGADSQRYTTADLTEILYQGTRFYVARTGCQYNTQTITPDAYTLLSDLPCDCIQMERVGWVTETTLTPLVATGTRDLDAYEHWWQRKTDTRSRAYFGLGLDRIGLWPVNDNGGESYRLEYQQDVPDSLDAVPIEDHECLVNYVVARFLLNEQKVADGMKEYGVYRACVDAAARRRSNVDRRWAMGTLS